MGSTGSPTGKHALVFGASGITGWATVNAILHGYPDQSTFSAVTALTNRPLSQDMSQWPKSDKLNIVSGLDLLKGSQSELENAMSSAVAKTSTVTHVYFFAYIMDVDPNKEIQINVDLLKRAVSAVEHLSKNLEFVILPTGTKAYGVHLLDQFPFKNDLPLKESLPRIPEPFASQMFYYNQLDLMKSMSSGKAWSFCDIIPDNINGFVPNNNIYCLAQSLAIYLSLHRHINGEGSEVVFPGTTKSWTNLFHDSSQDVTAKFAIYASLHPEVSSGESFNVADTFEPVSWSIKWPVICKYFGLKGVPPPSDGHGPDPTAYVADHFEEWKELEKKHDLQSGKAGNDRSVGIFPIFIMRMFDFNRQLDMTKMHKAWGGAKEEVDTKSAWWTAFERFRKAKIVP